MPGLRPYQATSRDPRVLDGIIIQSLSSSPVLVFELKVLVLIGIFVYAFFRFSCPCGNTPSVCC
ncbi:MAG TPA: hypothetical protein VEA40_02535 [Ramlibacter sp.]|nr:hypothetical protein [Ramlibacter sp.]